MLAYLLAGALCTSNAASINLVPSADTSLMEVAPSNNNGAQEWVLAGTTQNGPRTRALMRFDLSAIPSNAVIQAASLTVFVTRKPDDGFEVGTFSLHRMLRPWGEGSKSSLVNPGKGEPATEGEATWLHSLYPTNLWSAPGGAPGLDFSPWESAFQMIYGPSESPFVLESTPEIVADVQQWLDGLAPNYGWIFLCNEEEIRFTGRRFGSREDVLNAPVLSIAYLVQPVLRDPQKMGDFFQFWFTAYPLQAYVLEEKTLSGTWTVIAQIPPEPDPQKVRILLSLGTGGRLYRLRAE